jgi:hypothetical protein
MATRTKRPTTPKVPPKVPPEAITPPAATEPVTPAEPPVKLVEPPVTSVEVPIEQSTETSANAAPSGFTELGTSLLDKIDQVRASFAQLAPKPSTDATAVVAVDSEVEPSSAMAIADQPSNEEIRRSPTIVQILTTVKQARWE